MKLNPIMLLSCCLFSTRILCGEADLPFALEWKVGKTYWLDVRQEERSHYDQPYPRERIRLERVMWSLLVLQKRGDSILLKAIAQRQRSQDGELNNGSYFDSWYHQKPEDFLFWSFVKKEFLVTVDAEGRVLRHQMILNGKNTATQSNLKKKPFFWQLEPPILEREIQRSPAQQKSKYEVETFFTIPNFYMIEKEDFLTHFFAGKDQQLTIDKKSQWIKYGSFSEISALKSKQVWLRGWSEPVATVRGKFSNFNTKGALKAKEEVLNYLRFRCGVKARFDLNTDGSFFLNIPLTHNIAFYLFDVHVFLSPGDHLKVVANFKNQEQIKYEGNCAKENKLLNILRRKDQYFDEDGDRLVTIINTQKGVEPFYEDVKQDFIADSLTILSWQKQINPFCAWDVFWSHRYIEGYRLLQFYEFSQHPPYESLSPKKYLSRIESLPILNDWCEYSYEYDNFLGHSYLNYKATKLRPFNLYPIMMPRSSTNIFAKFMLAGDPLYRVLRANISSTYSFWEREYRNLEADAEDFINTCPDTVFAGNIKKFYDTEQSLSLGKTLPDFEVYNLKGKKLTLKKLRGKKTVFRLELGSHSFGSIEYAKLAQRYPSLNIVHVYPLPFREFKQKFSGKNLPPPYTEDNLFFPKDLAAAQLLHDRFCFNESSKWDGSSYGRLFFLNEAGIIADFIDNNTNDPRQIRADFAYRLQPFLAQKSALKPNLTWLYILLTNLLLGGGFLILRSRYIRSREARKRRLTEIELKSLRAQLNPHFIFNTMSSIQHLIASQDSEKANQYLADLAGLMRLVLRATQKGVISLSEELDLLEQYCHLENLRKPFSLDLNIDPNLNVQHCEVPALLLQPYVENAILHGLAPLNSEGRIVLNLTRKNNCLNIEILDNGIGLQQSRQKISNGTQSGLRMNEERLRLMYGSEANVQVIDLSEKNNPESGTLVTLKLPCC